MQTRDDTQQALDQRIVDFSFYMIQRGEAGHKRGPYLEEYNDSNMISTIGYGTVNEAGYNHLNYRASEVTHEQAIVLAKTEMQYKLYEKCRTQFKDYDKLLPCYQALILDTAYQGNWTKIVDAFNAGDMQAVYEIVGKNQNKERAAVRMRAVEMGMLVEDALKRAPNAKPEDVAKVIATQLIEKYKHLNGTDLALTKDELALLYYSCCAAYGIEVTPQQAEAFAMSFPEVASGVDGIGYSKVDNWTASFGHQPVSYQRGNSSYTPGGYTRGTGDILRTDRSTRPRKRLRDNYFSPVGGGVRPLEARIPTQRHELHGNVQYDRTYSSVHQGPRAGGQKPNMIVIHSTEDRAGASESATLKYLCHNENKVSAHIVIGRDGKAYMLVPPEMRANHAGPSRWLGQRNLNECSIGIEVVRAVDEGYTPEQAATILAVVAQLSQQYGIPPDRVLGHDEIAPGRKTDPGKDFDPIWDALAREGLAFDAATHADIRRQLGNNHSVHANKLNPALANARAEDSVAFIPNTPVPEGWTVVPLDIPSAEETAETEDGNFVPLEGEFPDEEEGVSEEPEDSDGEVSEDGDEDTEEAERKRAVAAREAETRDAAEEGARAKRAETDNERQAEAEARAAETTETDSSRKTDTPSGGTTGSTSGEGTSEEGISRSRGKKSSSKKAKRSSKKKTTSSANNSTSGSETESETEESSVSSSDQQAEGETTSSKPDASRKIRSTGAEDITRETQTPPADEKKRSASQGKE